MPVVESEGRRAFTFGRCRSRETANLLIHAIVTPCIWLRTFLQDPTCALLWVPSRPPALRQLPSLTLSGPFIIRNCFYSHSCLLSGKQCSMYALEQLWWSANYLLRSSYCIRHWGLPIRCLRVGQSSGTEGYCLPYPTTCGQSTCQQDADCGVG
jgi:hypothetical protein